MTLRQINIVVRKPIFQLFGGNLVSKILGLGREVLTAAFFGTGSIIGAYRVAQTGTLVPINFFTSDSLNAAFVPQYRHIQPASQEKAQTLFWSLMVLFGLVALVILGLLWGLADHWRTLLAPGLDGKTGALVIVMLHIMALGVPFYLLSALVMYLALANGDYVPLAVRPSVQNVGLIVGAVTAFAAGKPVWLAWGFTAAYGAFAGWVVVRAMKAGMLVFPQIWHWPSVREVLGAFWATLRPLLLLPVLLQGNIAVERAVASLIGLAAVSGIDYAKFVSETLIVLVSMPVAFSGLGHWSGMSPEEMAPKLLKVIVLVLLLAVPASAFLLANAQVIVDAVYARGAFDLGSTQITGEILFGIAMGLWGQVLGYVLIKALNAQLRNRAVLWVMALALVANAAFNLLAHAEFGAVTLGIGNSLYGLILMGGALLALDLWREALSRTWILGVAAAGYLLVTSSLPMPGTAWWKLVLEGGLALIYWALWVALVPRFRQAVLDAVAPKLGRAA